MDTAPDSRSRRLGWATAFAVATVLTLLVPTQHYFAERTMASLAERIGRPTPPLTPWTTFLLNELPVWYTWLLVCVPIVWLCRRFPLFGARRTRNLLLHIPFSVLAVGVFLMLVTAVRLPMRMAPPELSFLDLFSLGFTRYTIFFVTIYAGTVGIYHAAVYYNAYRSREIYSSQLQARLANAQLDVLTMQLQPHFLFNTLNSIAALMFKDVHAAQSMIVRLGELLRLSLERSSSHEVTLREELRFLEQYVEIQRMRFQDRLTVCYEIEPEAQGTMVPSLLLQPLVENAVRHGIDRRAGAGHITVRAGTRDGRVVLEVEDDGPGIGAAEHESAAGNGSAGIGIQNTRARLTQQYGDSHRFELENLQPHGLLVRISFPLRPAGAQLQTTGV